MGNAASNPPQPPMRIHKLHGKFLSVASDRLSAKRIEGYADSMFFGSRNAEREEKIELIITEMTSNWNGSLRFGFTIHSPTIICNHEEGIPRFMCPDLIKRGGSFVESLNHIKLLPGDRILFWVTTSGEVRLSINGVVQRSQVTRQVTSPVWPVVDLYGNTVGLKFKSLNDDPDQLIEIKEARYYSALNLTEMELVGNPDSIDIINKVSLKRKEINKAFIWNNRPLNLNHVWMLFIEEIDEYAESETSLAIGTSPPGPSRYLPNTLQRLTNRSVIFSNIYRRNTVGDELAVCIINEGDVMVALNGDAFQKIGTVPKSDFYWLVTDLNCAIKGLSSLGTFPLTGDSLPSLPNIFGVLLHESSQIVAVAERSSSSLPGIVQTMSLDGEPEREPEPSQLKCLLCKKDKPDSVFVDCGDICCCYTCANKLSTSTKKCPKCSKIFIRTIKVFF